MAIFSYTAARGFTLLGEEIGAWMDTTDGTTDITGGSPLQNLTENGTVTQGAVATGSGSFAYSGWSGSNYYELPYDSLFDFGTGGGSPDGVFSIVGWFKKSTSSSKEVLLSRGVSGGSPQEKIEIYVNATGTLYYGTYAIALSSGTEVDDGEWYQVGVVREAGVTYIYVNGDLVSQVADTTNQTLPTAVLRFGLDIAGANAFGGSLALWRITNTALSTSNIKTMYDNEKHLFKTYSFYTQYSLPYTFTIPLRQATRSRKTIRNENTTLSGKRQAIIHRVDKNWSIQTGWVHRTDSTNYPLLSELIEFIESTNKYQQFTVDMYEESENTTMLMISSTVTEQRTDTTDYYIGAFQLQEID